MVKCMHLPNSLREKREESVSSLYSSEITYKQFFFKAFLHERDLSLGWGIGISVSFGTDDLT